jgi:cysteine sulfinate desulfinase/cysteine desulfurase-like protein
MNIPEEVALGTLRLTLGRYTTEQDIITAARLIETALAKNSKE